MAVLSHFGEPVRWSDPEQVLDTAGASLRALAADSASLRAAIDLLDVEALDPGRGGDGAYWFELATSPEDDLSLWVRYCPTGCVAPVHGHRAGMLAVVLVGLFKQTLIGRGGGVGSPAHPIELFVRRERPGQLFALNSGQEHETSSPAGSMILVAMPAGDRAPGVVGLDEESRAKVEMAVERLRRAAREMSEGVLV